MKFKRDALQHRKRMETLERIKVHEFRREIRRKRLMRERKSRESNFGSKEERRIFEKGYCSWMPFTQADSSYPGPCEYTMSDHHNVNADRKRYQTSCFLSSPRKALTESSSYFEPRATFSSFQKDRGVKFRESDRVTTVSINQNPFLPEPVKVDVKDDWGPFLGRRELLKAKGRSLENVRSSGSLSRSLAQLGVTLSNGTLDRLFEYLQKKRIDREYRYNQVYGAAAQLRERRSASNTNSSWGPGEFYDASKDVRTIEGSIALKRGGYATMGSLGTRSDPTEWNGTARRDDFLREYRRRHLKSIKRDHSFERDVSSLSKSSSGDRPCSPFQYYIPDELRGRDIAELRSTLKNIWTEEKERGRKEALERAKKVKHDPLISELSKREIEEFNAIVTRRFNPYTEQA